MTLTEFNDLVDQAVSDLPDQFKTALSNLEILVEIWPTRQELQAAGVTRGWLFGLYQGVPQTRRGHYHAALPDKISIFAGPILSVFGSDPEIVKTQVRSTVLHEIGHHFGMSESQIRQAQNRHH